MPDADALPTRQRYARIAGLGYLIIIGAGIFAEFFVRSSLVVPGDAAATARNIAASELLFRAGIAADLVMLVCDVLVAVAIYVALRDVGRNLMLMAAFFRLGHAAVVATNLLTAYVPLRLVGGAADLAAFDPAQREALSLLLLETHAYGYALGLVFFGVYCLLLGHVVLRSGAVPRVLGVLLMVAGAGYLADSFGRTLLPRYADVGDLFAVVVFAPALVAELSFSLWLLVRGVSARGARGAGPEERA